MAMKLIANMTPREREALIHDLEVEHRVEIVAAAKAKRTMREAAAELASHERRITEIETGIALLR
ncbi:hypothetical protein SEA_CHANGELING_35 [Mycobacterium phage Changeling]|nr:hypothetical protein SEA_CHANGELING_35 [Mycobacterium phage Changeling]